MRSLNFILLDYGLIAIGRGEYEISFENVEEFTRYAGDDLANIVEGYDNDKLFYSSTISSFSDTKNPELNWENTGINSDFESLIEMFPDLAEKKSDFYYGMPDDQQLTEAKGFAFMEIQRLLRTTDAGLVIDSPLSEEQKEELIGYRDGLRDLATVVKNSTVDELNMVKDFTVPSIPASLNWDETI